MVASVARVVAALCLCAVLASAMPHRPHRSRDVDASLLQTSAEAHVTAGAEAMAQLQHMHHVELLRAPVPGALLADEPLADAAVSADPMFVEVASMQVEPLEFVGTRCVCAVWTNSQPVVGTNKGRTVIRGTCTASVGYESTEACNCWGLEVPCSSDKPTTKISTLSDFMPGACAAIRNETIKKPCDGPACPMFGYAETVASWKYEARNFTEGKEKCKLQTDRVACTNAKRCDCQVSGWSEWSPCDKKCGTGLSYRNRTVLLPASNGGSCPHLSETVKCMHSRCPRDCTVSAWGPWSECSSNCGSGYRYRTRQVTKTARNGGAECPALIDSMECVGTECTVNSTDCQFSEWSSWSTCSESCGAGTEVRSRTLISPKLAIGVPGCAWCTGCGALKQARPCNAVQCPRDCVVSDWSQWSKCSKSCGGGAKTRTRRILVTSQNNGAQCPRLFESQDCNTQDCPQDCEVGPWGEWSVCGASCGAGEQTRTRPVVKYPLAGGKKCPPLLERRNCDAGACSPQCKLSTWGPWSECSKSCGTGIKERRRYILEIVGNATEVDCGSLGEVAVCNTQACPSDCVLSAWRPAEQDRSGSPFFPGGLIGTNTNPTNRMQDPAAAGGQAFSKCTAECGGGWMFRQRDLVREAKGAGRACSTRYEAVPCALTPCPVDCIVSEWGSWSNCSTPCGEGTQTRTRTILRHPAHGGKTCPELAQDRSCAGLPCPKEYCPSAFWSDWSKCSSQCGTGQRSRTKMFESQTSKLGPRNVCGPLSDLGTCNSAPCPQDCVLADWGNWSQCSVSCGTGVQYRTRAVLRPNSNGGRPCAADLIETRACESNPCPSDCKVGSWSSWSECSSHCGDGVQYRLREVISPPLNGGKKCPRLMDARNCRNGACASTCQYGQWSPWSNCTHTCGSSGIARRSRPLFAGAKNECGDLIQELPCNVGPCPTNCEVSDWTEWSPCSDACDGLSYRRRLIKTPATFGGLPCPSLTETKSCSTPKCNTLAYKLSNPEGCQYRQRTPWGPCESDCGENPLKGTRRRFVLATPESRNAGCADKPEEEPCEIPDPTGELRANLRQQIADQLPKGGVMTQADGQKVQVNVHLNVLIKHQGKEGKVCPLTTTIEL